MANWARLQEQLTGLPVVKRARHGIHFDKGNGEIVANFSGKPCHYEDKGVWKPIDTTLLLGADGFYGCPHSPVKVHKDGRVKVDKSDYSQFTKLPGSPVGKVDGDRIVREFPGGRQYLYVTEDGFREEIVVDKPTFPLEKFIGKQTGTLPSAYKASPQTAVDANGDVFEITSDTKAFGDWLDGAAYPVTIDPDFGAGTNDAVSMVSPTQTWANARASYNAISLWGTGYKYLGLYDRTDPNWQIYRGFFRFDTSSIGAGSTVTQVNFTGTTVRLYTSADYDYLLVKYNWSAIDGDLTNSTNNQTAWDALLTADLDDNPWCNRLDLAVNTPKTSGNLSTSWINKTGITYYGLIHEFDRTNSEPAHAYYLERLVGPNYATESYRPKLTVTYTTGSAGVPKYFLHYARLRSN